MIGSTLIKTRSTPAKFDSNIGMIRTFVIKIRATTSKIDSNMVKINTIEDKTRTNMFKTRTLADKTCSNTIKIRANKFKTRTNMNKTFANPNKGYEIQDKAVPAGPPIPSLLSTLAKRTNQPCNPNFAKELISPSRSSALCKGSSSIEKIDYI
jgi:hypothetical protein